ncbi:hypothetical protein B0T12DRAFT_403361 [Alternaria alternata]|jgi:hypothetical protein|nr:hypothetical protein B0T12DRAFT_403361 [Alternaria alternata]
MTKVSERAWIRLLGTLWQTLGWSWSLASVLLLNGGVMVVGQKCVLQEVFGRFMPSTYLEPGFHSYCHKKVQGHRQATHILYNTKTVSGDTYVP